MLHSEISVFNIISINEKAHLSMDCYIGRSTDTANEPILEALYSLLLNYKTLKNRLSDLKELIACLVKSEETLNRQFLL